MWGGAQITGKAKAGAVLFRRATREVSQPEAAEVAVQGAEARVSAWPAEASEAPAVGMPCVERAHFACRHSSRRRSRSSSRSIRSWSGSRTPRADRGQGEPASLWEPQQQRCRNVSWCWGVAVAPGVMPGCAGRVASVSPERSRSRSLTPEPPKSSWAVLLEDPLESASRLVRSGIGALLHPPKCAPTGRDTAVCGGAAGGGENSQRRGTCRVCRHSDRRSTPEEGEIQEEEVDQDAPQPPRDWRPADSVWAHLTLALYELLSGGSADAAIECFERALLLADRDLEVSPLPPRLVATTSCPVCRTAPEATHPTAGRRVGGAPHGGRRPPASGECRRPANSAPLRPSQPTVMCRVRGRSCVRRPTRRRKARGGRPAFGCCCNS